MTAQQHRLAAVFSVFIAAFLFASGGAARAFANFIGSANQVAAWRVLAGGVCMVLVMAVRGHGRVLVTLTRIPLVWLMAGGVLLYQVTFFQGAQRIGVALGTLIAQAVAPTTAGLLTWATRNGRPTAFWLLCTAVAIAGLAMTTGSSGQVDIYGAVAVSVSGAVYAVNVVGTSHLVHSRGVTGMQVMTTAFGLAALMAIPIAVRAGEWLTTPTGLAMVAWQGPLATALAYLLFGFGITHLPAPTVSTLALAEPLIATVMGVFLLNETMTTRGWQGCAVITVALAGLAISGSRRPKARGRHRIT